MNVGKFLLNWMHQVNLGNRLFEPYLSMSDFSVII